MIKRNLRMMALIVSGVFLSITAGTAEESISISATVSASAYAGIGEDAADGNGYESELRLILEGEPEEGIVFRAEGGYTLFYGLASQTALAFDAGLAPIPEDSELPPGTDLHREPFLDQAYAAATLDRATFRAGVIPVAWGTAYLYNPTSRTAALSFPGEDIDITVGKPGMGGTFALPLPSTIPAGITIEAYALAAARMGAIAPTLDELDTDTFPFGTKMQLRTDYVDFSLLFLREHAETDSEAAYYYGTDAAGSIGDINWYIETVAECGKNIPSNSELSAGFSYIIPITEITLRGEYIRLGKGETDSAQYDVAAFFSGDKILLGRDYFYAGLEREDTAAGYWKLTGGTLVNLNDKTAAILAEASLFPRTILEIGVFMRWFPETSDETGEFGGTRLTATGSGFQPYRSVAGLSVKWTF